MKNELTHWKRVESRSISNLHVFVVTGKEVGFIEKPKDVGGDKNMWRAYYGIGEQAKFIGHGAIKAYAQELVEVRHNGGRAIS